MLARIKTIATSTLAYILGLFSRDLDRILSDLTKATDQLDAVAKRELNKRIASYDRERLALQRVEREKEFREVSEAISLRAQRVRRRINGLIA